MLRLLILSAFLHLSFCAVSQAQDFISVRKKNGRHIKTFIKSSPILFKTNDDYHIEGWITSIKNDSVFVRVYHTQRITTMWGSAMLDTIRSAVVPFHYKEISRIKISNKHRFVQTKLDKLLVIGGVGYIFLNVFNAGYLNESVTSKENLKSLGIALGAVTSGLIIKWFFRPHNFSHKNHRIVYVHMEG